MTITLNEQDVSGYRARVENHTKAFQLWVYQHSVNIAAIQTGSDSDMDKKHDLLQYFGNNPLPRLSLFDL